MPSSPLDLFLLKMVTVAALCLPVKALSYSAMYLYDCKHVMEKEENKFLKNAIVISALKNTCL